jgi:hypothetical protein
MSGIISQIIKFLSCSDLYKYVLNDSECHSTCGEDCCKCDIETHKIEIEDDEPEPQSPDLSIKLGDWGHIRSTKSNN